MNVLLFSITEPRDRVPRGQCFRVITVVVRLLISTVLALAGTIALVYSFIELFGARASKAATGHDYFSAAFSGIIIGALICIWGIRSFIAAIEMLRL
jgi:hypothetical protein